MTLLVRHARAGSRNRWCGDDLLRPLDEGGLRRASELVELLAGYEITLIVSSPAMRCVQTVEPLALARGLVVEHWNELGEVEQSGGGRARVRALPGSAALLCGHGGLEHSLSGAPRFRKGAVLVFDEALHVHATL